jgi:hypothetical protein
MTDQNPYQPPHAPGPSGPQHGYPGAPRPNQELEYVVPVNVSGLAFLAGYMGLAAALCVPAPLALLLGILALKDLEKHPEKSGKGRAWFAIVAGALGTLLLVVGVIVRATK